MTRVLRVYAAVTAVIAHAIVFGVSIHDALTCTEWCLFPWWYFPGLMIGGLAVVTCVVLVVDHGLARHYSTGSTAGEGR